MDEQVQVGSTACEPFVVIIPATTVLGDLWNRVGRDVAMWQADGVVIDVVWDKTQEGVFKDGTVSIDTPLWSLTASFSLRGRQVTVTVTQKPFLMPCFLIEERINVYLNGHSIELPERAT